MRPVRLRTTLIAFTAVLAVVSLLVSTALMTLTGWLHDASLALDDSFESVRLAEETQSELLVLARSADSAASAALARDLSRKLSEAGHHVTTGEEADVFRNSLAAVDGYVAARQAGASEAQATRRLDAALAVLERLADINKAQAREAQARTAKLDAVGKRMGATAAGLIVVVSAGLLLWLRSRLLPPLFELAGAMERFGTGDRSARAPEWGPAELREMARRFNETAEALGRQRQDQLTFLAGVAHDLRSPLNVLRMSAELLRPEMGLGREQAGDIAERVRRQVTRLDRMVGDLLETSRIEAGALSLDRRWCDARGIAKDAADLLEGRSTAHQLEVQTPPEAVPVWCDPLRIEQVLTNLLSNAVKYSPMGGAVVVRVAAEAAAVRFSVADQGIGMNEDEARYAFEPFRRGGRLKDDVPGVGLGLFVVRRIVEAHGGTIALRSAPGEGSTFEVRLPVQVSVPRPNPDEEPVLSS
jgi:signal transduction histidine kinase